MNQKKMGAFIKTLRKENNLTQEQLAEALSVSNRTVSRWETGSNIPDLDMLIIISDFFGIEIKELIDGERIKEKEIYTEPENLQAVADFSKDRENSLIKKIYFACFYGIAAWILFFIFSFKISTEANSGWILVAFESYIILLYGAIMFMFRCNRTTEGCLSTIIGAGSTIMTTNISLLSMFFSSGSYYNHGLKGAYTAAFTIVLCFIVSCISVTVRNKKSQRKH